MDFDFPPDTLMLRDILHRLVQKEARPLEMKYFNTGRLEPEEQARLRSAIEQMGLWGATIPEKFGGGGLDTLTACVIEEELGGTFIPVEMGDVPALLYACTGDQVGRFLEPALAGKRKAVLAAREPGGVRPEAWTTTASPESQQLRLKGTKVLSATPAPNDFLIVLAKAPAGITAYLLESAHPGLTISNHNGDTATLQDVLVGKDAVLGETGRSLASAAAEGPRAWIRTGARYLGIVQRLLTMATEHAKDWVSLGAPLSVRPAVQRQLAETSVELESARWLVYHAAWLADKGQPVRLPAAQVRLATGQMLQRAIDRVTSIFGGPAPAPNLLPQRMVRSRVSPEALELALDYARAAVANELLAADTEK
jgi:acyl-CoA dehydrogenase